MDDGGLFDSIDVESFVRDEGPLSYSNFNLTSGLLVMTGGVEDVSPSLPSSGPMTEPNRPTVPGSSKLQPSKSRGGRPGTCSCKQSRCIKLYCDCFSVMKYCDGCTCKDCENFEGNPEVEKARKIVLKRQPKAFDKKFETAEGVSVVVRCGLS